jgi:hypothetical protein
MSSRICAEDGFFVANDKGEWWTAIRIAVIWPPSRSALRRFSSL